MRQHRHSGLIRRETYGVFHNVVEAIAILPTTTMQSTYVHFELLPGDVDDNKFVDCAIASNAELIVTNDKDFNPLKSIP